jgi:hypothetical protein
MCPELCILWYFSEPELLVSLQYHLAGTGAPRGRGATAQAPKFHGAHIMIFKVHILVVSNRLAPGLVAVEVEH